MIRDIEEKASELTAGAPAIIIIGEVVKESPKLMEIYKEALVRI
jgi:uroporphyrin-III C-methyltransferase